MKHFRIVAFLAVALIATSAFAQQRQNREEMINQRIQALDKALDLSDDQVAKIKEMYSQMGQRGGDRQQGGNDQQAGARPQAGASGRGMGTMNEDMEKILTPDQVKAYRQYQIDESVNRRLDQIDERIVLTDAQKKSVQGILVKEAEDNRTMMERMRGSEDTDRRASFQKMQEQRKKTDEAILKVLDKNQQNQYKSMMNDQQRRRPQR